MRLRSTVTLAALGAATLMAAGFAQSAPTASASPDVNMYYECQSNSVYLCMKTQKTLGDQVLVTTGSSLTTFELINGKDIGGDTFYEYEQTGTSHCLEVDANENLDVITDTCVAGRMSQLWYHTGTGGFLTSEYSSGGSSLCATDVSGFLEDLSCNADPNQNWWALTD